jgi:predicted nucleic acid-binding protein
MPDPVTVSNSSCLIALELIGRLDLLLARVRDVLDDLAAARFRISDPLIQDTLRRAGE